MNLNRITFIPLYLLLTVFTFLSACDLDDVLTTNHFDQKAWKALHGSLVIENPRAKMVDDLKTNYLKAGMSQVDVEALLGKADRIRNKQFLYRVGISKFSTDYSFLTLIYDDKDKLKEILNGQS
jgi:hypothetical protein